MFLPLAYDPHVFFPIDNQNKDIDILFVGTIYISPKRISILTMLIDAFPDKKIQIYGHYKPFYKNILKWLFREKRNIFKNRNISPKKVNELFSRTKIALNIHQSQTINGANPRLFEAAGAGVYQISDYNEYIRTLFSNGEIGFYDNDQQLIQCIEEALNNDNSAAALNARHLVEKQHTFLNRIDYVLQLLNNADTL